MEAELELRRLCTNLAIELLEKGRSKHTSDLGEVMSIAKAYYLLSKHLEVIE